MATSFLVTVNGDPFATVTTSANAHMLKDKINKFLPGAADVAADPLLYNPKHVDALAALGIDPDAPAPAVPPARKGRATGTRRAARPAA